MPVVVQYTTDVGREEYDIVALAIRFHDEPPPGLIVHTAAVTGDGRMRIFDVWQTLEDHDRFVEARLRPATMELVGDRVPVWPEPEVHHLHSLVKPVSSPASSLQREHATHGSAIAAARADREAATTSRKRASSSGMTP